METPPGTTNGVPTLVAGEVTGRRHAADQEDEGGTPTKGAIPVSSVGRAGG